MPVAIGCILQSSASFNGALLFVGLHGLLAVLSYWVVVGPTGRFTFGPTTISPARAGTKVA